MQSKAHFSAVRQDHHIAAKGDISPGDTVFLAYLPEEPAGIALCHSPQVNPLSFPLQKGGLSLRFQNQSVPHKGEGLFHLLPGRDGRVFTGDIPEAGEGTDGDIKQPARPPGKLLRTEQELHDAFRNLHRFLSRAAVEAAHIAAFRYIGAVRAGELFLQPGKKLFTRSDRLLRGRSVKTILNHRIHCEGRSGDRRGLRDVFFPFPQQAGNKDQQNRGGRPISDNFFLIQEENLPFHFHQCPYIIVYFF